MQFKELISKFVCCARLQLSQRIDLKIKPWCIYLVFPQKGWRSYLSHSEAGIKLLEGVQNEMESCYSRRSWCFPESYETYWECFWDRPVYLSGNFFWRIVQKVLSQLFSSLLVTVVKLFFYFVDTKNFSSFIRRKETTRLLFLSLSWASQVYSTGHTFT